MSTETQRAEFEVWYVTDMHRAGFTHATVEDVRKLRDGDGYGKQRAALNGKWKGWQAAQSSQAAEIEALKADIATYVRAASEQATEIEALRKENEAMRAAAEKLHLVKIFMLGWKGSEPCKRNQMEQEVEHWITAFDELFSAMQTKEAS